MGLEQKQAFVIMRIGNSEMDAVYCDAIAPAIIDAGLIPNRVDRDNEGDVLHSEIVRFIRESDIVVADLTGERPNVYYEVGYALGLGKQRHLVIAARKDHRRSSDTWKRGDPYVHFDLEGYDIVFWDPADLARYRADLQTKIRQRLRSIERAAAGALAASVTRTPLNSPRLTVNPPGVSNGPFGRDCKVTVQNRGKETAYDARLEVMRDGVLIERPISRVNAIKPDGRFYHFGFTIAHMPSVAPQPEVTYSFRVCYEDLHGPDCTDWHAYRFRNETSDPLSIWVTEAVPTESSSPG